MGTRAPNTNLQDLGIPDNGLLHFKYKTKYKTAVTATIASTITIKLSIKINGRDDYETTTAAKLLLGKETGVNGMRCWMYQGKTLEQIRREKEGSPKRRKPKRK